MRPAAARLARLRRVVLEPLTLPGAVLLLGVAATLMLIGTDSIRERLFAQDVALYRTVTDLQMELATAHIWMQRYLGGADVTPQTLDASLANARDLVRLLHEGRSEPFKPSVFQESLGRSLVKVRANLGGGAPALTRNWVPPVDDPVLRRQVEEISRRLEAFSAAADRAWREAPTGGRPALGSAADREHDRLYADLADRVERLRAGIEPRIGRSVARARLLSRGILAGWILFVTLAFVGLVSREHRRRRAEAVLREREAQLLQSQKLEAVGRLAGGLAHDINNYLAAMSAQCELVRRRQSTEKRVVARMDTVIGTAGKASALIDRLLAFSRRQPVESQVVSLNEVVGGVSEMLERLTGDAVEVETRFDPDLWPVRIDPAQGEQLLVNLVVNAWEAMPGGGRITVETANRRVAGLDPGMGAVEAAGDYVMLRVADSGPGIPQGIRHKIFEPFFSTKEERGASGLGLATVYGIVQQTGGGVRVGGGNGEGAVFEIYLPRCREEPAAAPPASRPAGAASEPGGSEHLLLVEDCSEVRESLQALLGSLGYRVTAVADGTAALELESGLLADVDLVIADVAMPGLTGPETVALLEERRGPIPALLMSGHPEPPEIRDGRGRPRWRFLRKPLSAGVLAATVREVLAAAAPGREPLRRL